MSSSFVAFKPLFNTLLMSLIELVLSNGTCFTTLIAYSLISFHPAIQTLCSTSQ